MKFTNNVVLAVTVMAIVVCAAPAAQAPPPQAGRAGQLPSETPAKAQCASTRGLGEAVRAKYFTPVADGWKIHDEIRAMATFRALNLMQDFTLLGRFDVVFCDPPSFSTSKASSRSRQGPILGRGCRDRS